MFSISVASDLQSDFVTQTLDDTQYCKKASTNNFCVLSLSFCFYFVIVANCGTVWTRWQNLVQINFWWILRSLTGFHRLWTIGARRWQIGIRFGLWRFAGVWRLVCFLPLRPHRGKYRLRSLVIIIQHFFGHMFRMDSLNSNLHLLL